MEHKSATYEIPCRLKVLHEIVIRFADLGRFEVAIPICRLALHEYEDSVGLGNETMVELQQVLAKMYGEYTDAILIN